MDFSYLCTPGACFQKNVICFNLKEGCNYIVLWYFTVAVARYGLIAFEEINSTRVKDFFLRLSSLEICIVFFLNVYIVNSTPHFIVAMTIRRPFTRNWVYSKFGSYDFLRIGFKSFSYNCFDFDFNFNFNYLCTHKLVFKFVFNFTKKNTADNRRL